MDPETRNASISTILKYARSTDDWCLLELIGWTPNQKHTTEQAQAVIAAVVPLLDDARLDDLIHHIAQVLVNRSETTTEVQ